MNNNIFFNPIKNKQKDLWQIPALIFFTSTFIFYYISGFRTHLATEVILNSFLLSLFLSFQYILISFSIKNLIPSAKYSLKIVTSASAFVIITIFQYILEAKIGDGDWVFILSQKDDIFDFSHVLNKTFLAIPNLVIIIYCIIVLLSKKKYSLTIGLLVIISAPELITPKIKDQKNNEHHVIYNAVLDKPIKEISSLNLEEVSPIEYDNNLMFILSKITDIDLYNEGFYHKSIYLADGSKISNRAHTWNLTFIGDKDSYSRISTKKECDDSDLGKKRALMHNIIRGFDFLILQSKFTEDFFKCATTKSNSSQNLDKLIRSSEKNLIIIINNTSISSVNDLLNLTQDLSFISRKYNTKIKVHIPTENYVFMYGTSQERHDDQIASTEHNQQALGINQKADQYETESLTFFDLKSKKQFTASKFTGPSIFRRNKCYYIIDKTLYQVFEKEGVFYRNQESLIDVSKFNMNYARLTEEDCLHKLRDSKANIPQIIFELTL